MGTLKRRIIEEMEPKEELPSNHAADCGSCHFWESIGVKPGSERGEQHGNCRRHAPVLVMIGHYRAARFPTTSELDWCGDWKSWAT